LRFFAGSRLTPSKPLATIELHFAHDRIGGIPMPAKPIPEGYHTLNAHLAVDDAAQAIEFYKRAFGAKERERVPAPDGKIAHAEIEIGDSVLMLGDPMPQSPFKSPKDAVGLKRRLDRKSAIADSCMAAGNWTMPLVTRRWRRSAAPYRSIWKNP